jgi:hypothetical protein
MDQLKKHLIMRISELEKMEEMLFLETPRYSLAIHELIKILRILENE